MGGVDEDAVGLRSGADVDLDVSAQPCDVTQEYWVAPRFTRGGQQATGVVGLSARPGAPGRGEDEAGALLRFRAEGGCSLVRGQRGDVAPAPKRA